MANSRVGKAYVTIILPRAEGSVCVQGERGAEDIPEDVGIIVQYAFKDAWDQSDMEHIYETSHKKCKQRCFLLIAICFAHTP